MMLEARAGDSLLPSQDRTTLVHSDVWRDLQATLQGVWEEGFPDVPTRLPSQIRLADYFRANALCAFKRMDALGNNEKQC
jgi:hypothetical protein